MNSTQASCGHPVIAVGAPGSPARAACESSPCGVCLAPLRNAILAIRGAKWRNSVRYLDAIYGPQAAALRAQVASALYERPITKSAKESQYGRLRLHLMNRANVTGNCAADADANFETFCQSI